MAVQHARLAQSVERGTFNPEVKGSSLLSGEKYLGVGSIHLTNCVEEIFQWTIAFHSLDSQFGRSGSLVVSIMYLGNVSIV